MSHTCHAHDCEVPVPPRMFMCRAHWFALCQATRDAVWHEYRPGQERDKRPSLRYLAVQRFAVGEVVIRAAGAMGSKPRQSTVKVASRYFEEAATFRQRCIEGGLGDPLEDLLHIRDALIPLPKRRRSARGLKNAS